MGVWKWWEKPVKALKADPDRYERAVAAQEAVKGDEQAFLDWFESLFGGGGAGYGGGGGGGGYRPQTPEEAALLGAQAAYYGAQATGLPFKTRAEADLAIAQQGLVGAQATDIPLAREQSRRQMLAEVGVAQAERAANPRRIFEALYSQARLQPTEMAKSLQEKMTIPGFRLGGRVTGAAKGKVVEGPALSRVGKHDDEYALLAPGSVVAPKPEGEPATVGNALSAILYQMRGGGAVSRPKAKKMLKHGEVRGQALTERQKGLFGLIAGGGTPTRLRKAQGGMAVGGFGDLNRAKHRPGAASDMERRQAELFAGPREVPSHVRPDRVKGARGGREDSSWPVEFGLPGEVAGEFEKLRQQATETILEATRKGTKGTSLYDPMGGGRFAPGQADYLRGLNIRQFGKLSPTQQKTLFSMLSAGGVEPEDFTESLSRQFRGLNPVAAGTRSRFAGLLGR